MTDKKNEVLPRSVMYQKRNKRKAKDKEREIGGRRGEGGEGKDDRDDMIQLVRRALRGLHAWCSGLLLPRHVR